jgi:hypothetical protein
MSNSCHYWRVVASQLMAMMPPAYSQVAAHIFPCSGMGSVYSLLQKMMTCCPCLTCSMRLCVCGLFHGTRVCGLLTAYRKLVTHSLTASHLSHTSPALTALCLSGAAAAAAAATGVHYLVVCTHV